MAWVAVPGSNNIWEYENTATSSNTYPDAPGIYSGGVRTYTKPGTSDTVTTYARTRVKGEINLFYRDSEDFSTWIINSGVTITTNTTIAPNDSITADSMTEKTTTQPKNVYVNFMPVKSGEKYTFSIYAKYNGRHLQLSTTNPFGIGINTWANFNLQTGTLGIKGTDVTDHKIQDVGNGWYRCSITTPQSLSTSTTAFWPSLITTDNAPRSQSYLGDGVSGIFIWGAMVSESEYLKRYIKTTNSASTTIERGELSKTYYDNQ